MQSEALRSVAIGQALTTWKAHFGELGTAGDAAAALSKAAPAYVTLQDGLLLVHDRSVLTLALEGAEGQAPLADQMVWLGWLLAWSKPVRVETAEGGWTVLLDDQAASALPDGNWLASDIEELLLGL